MKSLIFAIFILNSTYLFSQDPSLSQKQKSNWREANELIEIKDYYTAKLYLDELLVTYPNWAELNYKLGICAFQLKIYDQATKNNFLKASEAGIAMAYYYLGSLYHFENNFELALKAYEQYLSATQGKEIADSEIIRQKEITIRAKEYLHKPVDLAIKNMGAGINSKYPDYAPLITSDESMLFFTSRRNNSTGGKLDPYGKFFEDIYVSSQEKGIWKQPIQMEDHINDGTHNACVGLSPEGNILILYKTDKTWTAGDLYWSELDGENWSEPVMYSKNINTKYVESSASYTPDGKTLYFSSDKPGGFGGKDLYRVTQLPNGEWSLPISLGEKINTPYDDDAPFIHPNNTTLYFSSKGHQTIGGYDVFKSEWNHEMGWSEPNNMGHPINTTRDDIFFTVSADGKMGYFSSLRDEGLGDQDIYQVELVKDPAPVIRGKVVSSTDTLSPIKASITLEKAKTDQLYGTYKTNAKTGNFIMIASDEHPYRMIIEAAGYETQDFEIKFTKQDITTTKLFVLKPKKK